MKNEAAAELRLKALPDPLTVCKIAREEDFPMRPDFYFLCRTDEELSLVCRTADAPAHTLAREDGWRAFRIEGMLDFSLIGILARLSGLLAEAGIGLFAVSTYNTDTILVRAAQFDRAKDVLSAAGYVFV